MKESDIPKELLRKTTIIRMDNVQIYKEHPLMGWIKEKQTKNEETLKSNPKL